MEKQHRILISSIDSRMEIIGHRGACFDAPENTLASFKLGYEQDADAIEMDVQLTGDNQIVAIHDPDTRRTSGVHHIVSRVSCEILRGLEVGNFGAWAGRGFSEKIPTLGEVLALIPEGKRAFIEIKCGPEILPKLEEDLRCAGLKPEQTALIGFDYRTMSLAKKKFPKLHVYWLAGKARGIYPRISGLIKKAKAAGFDGLDLNGGYPINRALVESVHEAGLKLFTWTVNDPEVARAQAQAGVDGITTDRPGWLRRALASCKPGSHDNQQSASD